MMGTPIDGAAYILGDKKSVLTNTLIPTSVLRKKSNLTAYDLVREVGAYDEQSLAYVNTKDNVADLLTKAI